LAPTLTPESVGKGAHRQMLGTDGLGERKDPEP